VPQLSQNLEDSLEGKRDQHEKNLQMVSWKRPQMEKILSRCLVRRIPRILEMKSNNLKSTLFANITATGYCV